MTKLDGQPNYGAELTRMVAASAIGRYVVRLIRNRPDTHDKSRAFRRDVLNAIQATRTESEDFAGVPAYDDNSSLLEAALRRVRPELATWVELGVGSGASTKRICAAAARLGHRMTLHGFDSFQGLPEAWGEIAPAGTYAYPPAKFVEPNIRVHSGWFADTVPVFARERPGQIGFVHIDCDLYSSTKTAFDALRDSLRPGTVLLFDEYWNYLEAPEHEMRALAEFTAETGQGFEYIGYNRNYMEAAVVLTPR